MNLDMVDMSLDMIDMSSEMSSEISSEMSSSTIAEDIPRKRIYQLPPYLANQIAAGEVIERPASVLKELLENSIDAKSTQIDVVIEQGGIGLIRVQDNGLGICKDDLSLALSQHATSKISSLQDLESIHTYGFRGEALASISSVSHLNLQSYVSDADSGWSLALSGKGQQTLSPAPKSKGTIVEVRELFFNTPVRRKFLKSDRTELQHLEETFKKVVLSQPEIGFSIRCQDSKLKRYAPCHTEEAYARRVSYLLGNRFIEQWHQIDATSNGLVLKGWLCGQNDMHRDPSLQYTYINGRIVRDKVMTHAIRTAYQMFTKPGFYPSFVLFFSLDPALLDVNVHPTKHEVRFKEPRLVHAFLSYSVEEALKKAKSQVDAARSSRDLREPFKSYQSYQSLQSLQSLPSLQSENNTNDRRTYTRIGKTLLIAEDANTGLMSIINIPLARQYYLLQTIQQSYYSTGIKSLILEKPVLLHVNFETDRLLDSNFNWNKLGFELSCSGPNSIMVRGIPKLFEGKDKTYELSTEQKEGVLALITIVLEKKENSIEKLFAEYCEKIIQYVSYSEEEAVHLLKKLEDEQEKNNKAFFFYRKISASEVAALLFK